MTKTDKKRKVESMDTDAIQSILDNVSSKERSSQEPLAGTVHIERIGHVPVSLLRTEIKRRKTNIQVSDPPAKAAKLTLIYNDEPMEITVVKPGLKFSLVENARGESFALFHEQEPDIEDQDDSEPDPPKVAA